MTEQGFASTLVCLRWQCTHPDAVTKLPPEQLVLRGEFYVCARCTVSYGRNPHPDLPEAIPSRSPR